jgi:hypothetical protein
MSVIPLDLERRIEQRWAARFSRPAEPVTPQKYRPESQDKPSEPTKGKRETRRLNPVGFKPAPAV